MNCDSDDGACGWILGYRSGSNIQAHLSNPFFTLNFKEYYYINACK